MQIATYNRISKRELSKNGAALVRQRWETGKVAKGFSSAYTEFTDEQTGRRDDRPDFQALLQLIESGKLDILVVSKIDRITRDAETNARLAKLFEKKDLKIYEILLGRLLDWSNPGDWSYFVYSGVAAEEEIRRSSMRIKLAFDWRREQGKPAGGRIAFGYRLNTDGFYEIDPDKLDIAVGLIKIVIDERGATLDAVARGREELNTQFTRSGLSGWIRTETIRGNTRHRNKVRYNTHASLFDDPRLAAIDAHTAIDQIIKDAPRLRGDNRNHRQYPLSGLIKCGRCGGRAYIRRTTNKRYNRSYCFICCGDRQSRGLDCGGQHGSLQGKRGLLNTSYDLADRAVIEALKSRAAEIVARATESVPNIEEEPPEAKKLRQLIAKYEGMNDPDLAGVIEAKRQQLSSLLTRLEASTPEQRARERDLVYYINIPFLWENASDQEKAALYRDFVQSVHCDRDNIVVKLRV